MDLQILYAALQKKYGLPEYSALNDEFELLYIPAIMEVVHPLKLVRRRMTDKVGWLCNMLQTLLQPNPGS